jgi:hypothetical protein
MKILGKNLNWEGSFSKCDLDDKVTPLSLACYLGRTKVMELLV